MEIAKKRFRRFVVRALEYDRATYPKSLTGDSKPMAGLARESPDSPGSACLR